LSPQPVWLLQDGPTLRVRAEAGRQTRDPHKAISPQGPLNRMLLHQ